MKVEIKTESYKENFDFELIWKDEVDMETNNILNDYNLMEAFAAEAEESKQTNKKWNIHELLTDYADIIYTDRKELTKTNIIQYTIHLFNLTPIA